jgi:lysophospholipase
MPVKATIKSGQFIDHRHRKIVFKSWVLKKPVAQIYIIHGFSEHIDNYQDIIPILNNSGFSCHIMDLPGHGFSEGIRGHIDDFRDYTKNLDLFTKSNPYHQANKPVFLMGHSLGGAIVHDFALENNIDINGIILFSPLFGLPLNNKLLSPLFRWLSRKNKTLQIPKPCVVKHLNRTVAKKEYYQTDPLRLHCISPNLFLELEKNIVSSKTSASKLKTPLLIFASSKDQVVPYDSIMQYYQKVSSFDKKLVSYGEAMHELLQEEEHGQILTIASDWIKKRI